MHEASPGSRFEKLEDFTLDDKPTGFKGDMARYGRGIRLSLTEKV